MKYVKGYKGEMLPGPTPRPNDPRLGSTRPPRPAPTGPMTPVRGGGNLPKSLAVIARRAMKKGGAVKASDASKRADGCAVKGKTKGKMV